MKFDIDRLLGPDPVLYLTHFDVLISRPKKIQDFPNAIIKFMKMNTPRIKYILKRDEMFFPEQVDGFIKYLENSDKVTYNIYDDMGKISQVIEGHFKKMDHYEEDGWTIIEVRRE